MQVTVRIVLKVMLLDLPERRLLVQRALGLGRLRRPVGRLLVDRCLGQLGDAGPNDGWIAHPLGRTAGEASCVIVGVRGRGVLRGVTVQGEAVVVVRGVIGAGSVVGPGQNVLNQTPGRPLLGSGLLEREGGRRRCLALAGQERRRGRGDRVCEIVDRARGEGILMVGEAGARGVALALGAPDGVGVVPDALVLVVDGRGRGGGGSVGIVQLLGRAGAGAVDVRRRRLRVRELLRVVLLGSGGARLDLLLLEGVRRGRGDRGHGRPLRLLIRGQGPARNCLTARVSRESGECREPTSQRRQR